MNDNSKAHVNDVIKTMLERSSIRAYTDEKLTQEQISLLQNAALSAPTAMNAQDQRFVFVTNAEIIAELEAGVVEAACAGGRMVEVNTSGGYYACAEMFPAPGLLAAFRRAGVPCTVGCDSHDPANVARDIERAYGLMYEAGYRSVTVPTATGDRRSITIE